ncbi:MAG: 16S rRNA (guanine(527)-N(7))-methyltransferase RsmG [Eubacteriales bacterium]
MGDIQKQFIETLISGFAEYKYNVSKEQLDKFVTFNKMVMSTNKHTNLTAIEDGAESAKKHFLDSVNPAAMEIVKNADSVIDIGSGAGFPGIPLAILNPQVQFTLVDTRQKRCEFMNSAVEELNLENTKIIWNRAEELGKDTEYREKFEIACARALAATPTLLEYLSPFVKIGGKVMLYKSKYTEEELSSSESAANILNISDFNIIPYSILGDNSSYNIILGKKTNATPIKYPRKSGIPTKRPL